MEHFLSAQHGPDLWGLHYWNGQELFEHGSPVPTEDKATAALGDEGLLWALMDKKGRRLRLFERSDRDLVPIDLHLPTPSGYLGDCLAVHQRVLYMGCRPSVRDWKEKEAFPDRLLCLDLDDVAAGWQRPTIPEDLWQPRKTLDHLFFRQNELIAVDNIVTPKYILVYDLPQRGRPHLKRVVTIREFGAGGSILGAAMGRAWMAVRSSAFYWGEGEFCNVEGLAILQTRDLDERWHYHHTTTKDHSNAPQPVFVDASGGLEPTSNMAFDGDLLLLAGGERGIGVIDLRGQALRDDTDATEREKRRRDMAPGPEVVYIDLPELACADKILTLDGHEGCFVIHQSHEAPWTPRWVPRQAILDVLEEMRE